MSGPDETLPPGEPSNDTIPPPRGFGEIELPAEQSSLVIPAGQARAAVAAALHDLLRAFGMLEATVQAVARQLDAQATTGAP